MTLVVLLAMALSVVLGVLAFRHSFARPVFETREVTAADLRAAEADVAQAANATTWTAYASALRGRRQLDKAIDAARKGLEVDPAHLEARYELGLALEERGHHDQARAELEKVAAVEETFASDRVLFVLARAQQGCGDNEAARVSLEALAGRSGHPEVLYECALVQARLGDRAAAAENLQRIITEAKEVPDYLEPNVRPWVRKSEQALGRLRG